MMLNLVVAALSFSAPPSLTRRDMMVGFGAAAAAMAPLSPALADASKYAGAADRKKAEFLATLPVTDPRSPSYVAPYVGIMKKASETEAAEKAARTFGSGEIGNGKSDGVTFRKPYDPNGCSAECKSKRMSKY